MPGRDNGSLKTNKAVKGIMRSFIAKRGPSRDLWAIGVWETVRKLLEGPRRKRIVKKRIASAIGLQNVFNYAGRLPRSVIERVSNEGKKKNRGSVGLETEIFASNAPEKLDTRGYS